MPKASENSVLLSMSRGRAEQTLGLPPLPQHGAGATWLQHEQMWQRSDAWAAVVGKALQLTMSTHQPPGKSPWCVTHSFSPAILTIAQGNETFLHISLLLREGLAALRLATLPSPEGNRQRPTSSLVHQTTLMRPCVDDIWGIVRLNIFFFPSDLELSHLQALFPEQSTRHPMLWPRWTFGIWIRISPDSQFYPPTTLESLARKNRGDTVTDIFRKGMHM